MQIDLSARTEFVVDLSRRAGALGMDYFRRLETLTIESKGHQDMVSEADREVELFIRAELAKAFPDDGIVGEEHAPVKGKSGFDWIIDPIDGTINFVTGIPQWCVIIAGALHGEALVGAIHDPNANETFHGYRGGGAFMNGRPIKVSDAGSVRDGTTGVGYNNRAEARNILPVVDALIDRGGSFYRNGSGGMMLSFVAAGRLVGYVEEHMNAWDCLAAMLLIEEAGGTCVKPDPASVIADGTVVVCGGPGVFDELESLAREHFAPFG